MTDESTTQPQDMYQAMPPGAVYAMLITGPKFGPIPDVGRRILVYLVGENEYGWEYDSNGGSLVTGTERSGMSIAVHLKRL